MSFLRKPIGEPFDAFDRARHAEIEKALFGARHRPRKPRKPTVTSVKKQLDEAGIDVAIFEFKPDGTIAAVTGKSESPTTNPWLDDLKVTKQ